MEALRLVVVRVLGDLEVILDNGVAYSVEKGFYFGDEGGKDEGTKVIFIFCDEFASSTIDREVQPRRRRLRGGADGVGMASNGANFLRTR
ncbi:hypothetical protein CRG98_040727 [Punica granatum]|uniref:Uncharacterized protein n=1 Tax=Punica granatum TaxID=22663 RepID=A0A2I0I4K6_PUNGR|nr:hypothetical protein CRG98_040727 [Punica granatum]